MDYHSFRIRSAKLLFVQISGNVGGNVFVVSSKPSSCIFRRALYQDVAGLHVHLLLEFSRSQCVVFT
jgi:hypothetical protein